MLKINLFKKKIGLHMMYPVTQYIDCQGIYLFQITNLIHNSFIL